MMQWVIHIISLVLLNSISVNSKHDEIDYSFNCKKSPIRNTNDIISKYLVSAAAKRSYTHDQLDTDNKIRMSWTPKAGCTQAGMMFFDNIGLQTNKPHSFRPSFYKQ